MTKQGRSIRPRRQSNHRHGRRSHKKTTIDPIDERPKDIIVHDNTMPIIEDAQEDFVETLSVIDGEERPLGSDITLVDDDTSLEDLDVPHTPLSEVLAPLSEAPTVVEIDDNDSPTLSIRRAGLYRHPHHHSRSIPADPPPLENALGLDLGPPVTFAPFDAPSKDAAAIERPIPPQTPARNVALRRRPEPRYAMPTFMVAPSSIQAPKASRMLSASRRRPQPRPEEVKAAWHLYAEQWKGLLETDPHRVISSKIPWPILDHKSSSITPDDIQDLLLSSTHSTNLSAKKRIREALRLYHPDRFEKLVVERIEGRDERAKVRERAGLVVRSLNTLLERES